MGTISCSIPVTRELEAPERIVEYGLELRCNEQMWRCWHRFSDFERLQSQLRNTVTAAAAPLPQKELLQWHSTSSEIVEQRAPALCAWLSTILAEESSLERSELLSFIGLLSNMPPERPVVHVDALSRAAETGDVILFRTAVTMVPAIQRAVTLSAWDHVGLIVFRDRRQRVCAAADAVECGFVEADASGCRFYGLDDFNANEWHRLYSAISLRRLECAERQTAGFFSTLDEWSKQVLGKPYELTLAKIAPGLAPKKPDVASSSRADGTAGFFCSELVAHAYQAVGLLPTSRPASGYWPVTFAAASGLQLLGDSRLLDEEPVEFGTPGVATLQRVSNRFRVTTERAPSANQSSLGRFWNL